MSISTYALLFLSILKKTRKITYILKNMLNFADNNTQ